MNGLIDRWSASWIWYPGAGKTVNFHFFARKTFALASPVSEASLHIFAFTDYKLFINGKFLGRGPNPSDPYHFQYYDTYPLKKHLKPGRNVIGIICHNYGIGTHWQPVGPGGLIAQCEIKTKAGVTSIVSDGSWKVKKADCWYLNSPRMYRSCGFLETFDFKRYAESWMAEDCRDGDWDKPEVLGAHPLKPWINLIPREIPFLEEKREEPVNIEKGKFTIQGFHAIRFAEIIPEAENCLGYAQTYFHADRDMEVTLSLGCDDAFKVLLNDELILDVGYNEQFARTRRWYGKDEYEQRHYDMGEWKEKSEVTTLLKTGWNKVLVVIDQGKGGWGFILRFLKSGELIDIPFSNVKNINENKWTLAGPFVSSGMNNSLDNILSDIIESTLPAGIKSVGYHPFDYKKVTDYGRLMQSEKRRDILEISGKEELTLSEGEFFLIDFGKVKIGYPQIDIISSESEEAVIDVGHNCVLSDTKNILFSEDTLKTVDRIYIRRGQQKWEPFQRRTGRYIHISCRKGKSINIKSVAINSLGYPVREIGEFACSDGLLNRIWEVSRYTTRLLMQYGYQDCLRREEGTCNMSSFNYMSRSAGYCFGDYKLARKTLKMAVMTQNDTGWFDSHGISSPNSDEPAQCLWWIVWLKDYYLCSGDLSFVREVYENMADNIRYFSKMMNRRGLLDSNNEPIAWKGQAVYIDDGVNNIPGYRGVFDGELFGYNILYYAALNSASVLADELGFQEDSGFYRKKAERVKKVSNQRFWDDSRGLYVDWRKGEERAPTSSHALLIAALYFDISDKEKTRKVLRYICDDVIAKGENVRFTIGFYYYLLEVLFRHGLEDLALNQMRVYYGRWLELGGTTFCENYTLKRYIGKKKLDREYEVHGYGTSAHLHFYSNILGIRPLDPGFKKILFEPHPGDLKWAKGRVHTPQGEIQIAWRVKEGIFNIEIKMPEGCNYEKRLPKGFKGYQMVVNGKKVNL